MRFYLFLYRPEAKKIIYIDEGCETLHSLESDSMDPYLDNGFIFEEDEELFSNYRDSKKVVSCFVPKKQQR